MVGVLLAASFLGSRAGTLSIIAYLLLGAAGAPVFSLARGGLYMLAGPTGGYLIGFIPAVYLAGWILEQPGRPTVYRTTGAMLIALGIIYSFGGIQLGLMMRYTFIQVMLSGIIPFLIPDLFKVALAVFLSIQVKTSLHNSRLGHVLENK